MKTNPGIEFDIVDSSSPRIYQPDSTFRKTVLSNGVRILTERISYLKSVSMGIWVRSGSRVEEENLNGISHFLEHMIFKGTDRRTALQIAKEIDSVGGILNAFTSKELTSFYCKVLSENTELASDLLTDIYLNASFPDEEIEREKQVVYQEIHQLEDSPEDSIHEMLCARFWEGESFGRPILGTLDNVLSLNRDKIIKFKRDNYVPLETLVCAAGDVDHDRFVDLIKDRLESLENGSPRKPQFKPKNIPGSLIQEKDLEQVHVCLAVEGPSATEEDRHAGYIFNALFGGGMSSRLFQEVREKRGLAYSVYSFFSTYSDTGMLGIYASTEPKRFEELLDVIGKETLRTPDTITSDELQMAKNQIRGNVILAMESPEARMNRLAKGEIHFGKYISLDQIINDIDKVTLQELREFAYRLIKPGNLTATALGPISGSKDILSYFDQN